MRLTTAAAMSIADEGVAGSIYKYSSPLYYTQFYCHDAQWLGVHSLLYPAEDDRRCWVCHVEHSLLLSPARAVPQPSCNCHGTCSS